MKNYLIHKLSHVSSQLGSCGKELASFKKRHTGSILPRKGSIGYTYGANECRIGSYAYTWKHINQESRASSSVLIGFDHDIATYTCGLDTFGVTFILNCMRGVSA